jgi:hypothetical protein
MVSIALKTSSVPGVNSISNRVFLTGEAKPISLPSKSAKPIGMKTLYAFTFIAGSLKLANLPLTSLNFLFNSGIV